MNKLKQIFPNASQETIRLNPDARLQDTEPKRSIQPGVLGEGEGEKKSAGRIILRYTSYRQRLLDTDNCAGGTKFLTDALRYCGAIPGDQEDQIDLQISQKKVEKKTQEKTLIEITYPS